MAKFCEYRDMFKFNKNVMEDDWNDGQAYMVKLATKNGPAVSNLVIVCISPINFRMLCRNSRPQLKLPRRRAQLTS